MSAVPIRYSRTIGRWLLVLALLASALVLAPRSADAQDSTATEREAELDRAIVALESYGRANGTFRVAGGGYKGNGTGWFNYQGGVYTSSVAQVLAQQGHTDANDLPADPLHTNAPNWSRNDFMVYLCGSGGDQRVAVFANTTPGLATAGDEWAWWESSGCNVRPTQAPYHKTYFRVSDPINALGTGSGDLSPTAAEREAELDRAIVALESYGRANGTFRVAGGGYKGNGTGWFNYQGGVYTSSVAQVLAQQGHTDANDLPADPLHTNAPNWSRNDFMVYLCGSGGDQRVAVFANTTPGLATAGDERAWWESSGCNVRPTQAPYHKTYFRVSDPINALGTGTASGNTEAQQRLAAVDHAIAAFEDYARVNGRFLVTGTGDGGSGTGWFNYQGGSYGTSIARGLTDGGHLDANDLPTDPLHTNAPNWSPNDLMVYRCGAGADQRVAVFANTTAGLRTHESSLDVWETPTRSCNRSPIDNRGKTFYAVSRSLGEIADTVYVAAGLTAELPEGLKLESSLGFCSALYANTVQWNAQISNESAVDVDIIFGFATIRHSGDREIVTPQPIPSTATIPSGTTQSIGVIHTLDRVASAYIAVEGSQAGLVNFARFDVPIHPATCTGPGLPPAGGQPPATSPAPAGAPCTIGGPVTGPDECINTIWQDPRCEAGETVFSVWIENRHVAADQTHLFRLFIGKASSPNSVDAESQQVIVGPGQVGVGDATLVNSHSKLGEVYRARVVRLDGNLNPISVSQDERTIQLECEPPASQPGAIPDIDHPAAITVPLDEPALPVASNLNCTGFFSLATSATSAYIEWDPVPVNGVRYHITESDPLGIRGARTVDQNDTAVHLHDLVPGEAYFVRVTPYTSATKGSACEAVFKMDAVQLVPVFFDTSDAPVSPCSNFGACEPVLSLNVCYTGPNPYDSSRDKPCDTGLLTTLSDRGIPFTRIGRTDGINNALYHFWYGPTNIDEVCAAGLANCAWDFQAAFEVATIAGGFVPVLGEAIDAGYCIYDGVNWIFYEGEFVSTGLSCGALAAPVVPAAIVRRAGSAPKVIDWALGARNVDVGNASPSLFDDFAKDNWLCTGSFSGDTRVLLGSGESMALRDIEVGDEVWAANPDGTEVGPRRVNGVWPHQDTLVDLVVSGGTLRTTTGHQYWNQTDGAWHEASELDAGDVLATPAFGEVSVVGVDWRTQSSGEAFDLSIDEVPTFFVWTGSNYVLVHNNDCLAALQGWQSRSIQFGNEFTFLLRKTDMDHILRRHHPSYWDGSTAAEQTFFESSMSIADVENAIIAVAQQNRTELVETGLGWRQVEGAVNGKHYTLGVNNGHLAQFYPHP